MHFDFALILTVLTALSGAIWLLDRLLLRQRRLARQGLKEEAREPWPVDWSRSLFPVLLIVLLFRSFLFEPFRIPSGSMIPTLLIGDFILVNKYAYGLRLPVLNKKVVNIGDPRRGDVVVFRFPQDERINYIKRVIGLPGDSIVYRNKRLFINGDPVTFDSAESFRRSELKCDRPSPGAVKYREVLGEVEHDALIIEGKASIFERSWQVPPGHYFVMGDNRDSSNDSRVWGFVPDKNLVGRAARIWLNLDHRSGFCMDWSRVGDGIK